MTSSAEKHVRSGLLAMVGSSVFFSAMYTCAYLAWRLDPSVSSLAVSGVRIAVNLLFVMALAKGSGHDLRWLFGDGSAALWLRGVFGGLNIMVVFFAIQAIGIGESSFLGACSGPIVALFAPAFLGQKNTLRIWLAIAGALVGLYLLFEPRFTDGHPWGRSLALFSGVLAAGAYLMVASAGVRNSPESIIFYFCLVGVVAHLVYYAVFGSRWPTSPVVWAAMVGSGVAGSIAQQFMTVGYQRAPAAAAAAISYLTPVLNLVVGAVLFQLFPDRNATLGAALVLVFGVLLPFWRKKSRPDIAGPA